MLRYIKKLFDLLSDRRMPWFLFRELKKKKLFFLKNWTFIASKEKIKFCFTIDFEHDYGSSANEKESKGVEAFLKKFKEFKQIKCGDIFVQADLIPFFKKELQTYLSLGFSLGLHGLHHELWGQEKWFLEEKSISIFEREKKLKEALILFKNNFLPTPKAFRAPNMVIDSFTVQLLKKYKFTIDSSYSSFFGLDYAIKKEGDLYFIPVSADPIPQINWRFCLPFSNYKVLNFYNFIEMDFRNLEQLIERILRFSSQKNCPLFLVFLMHTWEFLDDIKINEFSKKLSLLEKQLPLAYYTLNSLSKSL